MEGQNQGGPGLGKSGRGLQAGCPPGTNMGGAQVGLLDRREALALAANCKRGQTMFVPQMNAASSVNARQSYCRMQGPDVGCRGGVPENQGSFAQSQAQFLASLASEEVRARARATTVVGPGGQSLVVPVSITSSLPAAHQMHSRKALALVGQGVTRLERDVNRDPMMRAAHSGPYLVAHTYTADSMPHGTVQKAAVQSQASKSPIQCVSHSLSMKPERREHRGGVRTSAQYGQNPSSNQNGTTMKVNMVQVSKPQVLKDGPSSSKFSYKAAAFLVPDETGVYQLVEMDQKVGQLGVSPLNPGLDPQQSSKVNGRPTFREGNHRNGAQSKHLSTAIRNINSLQNTNLDLARKHYQGCLQHLHQSQNYPHQSSTSRPGSIITGCNHHESNIQVGKVGMGQSQKSRPSSVPMGNSQNLRGGSLTNGEGQIPNMRSSPEPGSLPIKLGCTGGNGLEVDMLTAAQSLRNLSCNDPGSGESQEFGVLQRQNTECEKESGSQKDIGCSTSWKGVDLLLDAATRADDSMAKEAQVTCATRISAPLAESTTRSKERKMKTMGLKWMEAKSTPPEPLGDYESSIPNFFQLHKKFHGVTRTESGKFIARCRYKGAAVQIGVFECAHDASKAYDRFTLGLRGIKAETNHPRHEYLDFEISNAISAFNQKVHECISIRKTSIQPWLKAAKHLLDSSQGDQHDVLEPVSEASFESRVQDAVHVMSRLKSKSPSVFQEAIDRVQDYPQHKSHNGLLFKSAAKPFELLRMFGKKGMGLEDALASLEREIRNLPRMDMDNSQSDPLLCAADILRSLIAVWKSWGGKERTYSGPTEANVHSGRSTSSHHEDKNIGMAESPNNLTPQNSGEHVDRSYPSEADVPVEESHGAISKQMETNCSSPQPMVSDFLHLLANDIQNCAEESQVHTDRVHAGKRAHRDTDLMCDSDASSEPSSFNTNSGGGHSAHEACGPVVISGGRVRGRRPAPRRGSGRNINVRKPEYGGVGLPGPRSDTSDNILVPKRQGDISMSPRVKRKRGTWCIPGKDCVDRKKHLHSQLNRTTQECAALSKQIYNESLVGPGVSDPRSGYERFTDDGDEYMGEQDGNLEESSGRFNSKGDHGECTPYVRGKVVKDKITNCDKRMGIKAEQGQESCDNSTSQQKGAKFFPYKIMADNVEPPLSNDGHIVPEVYTPASKRPRLDKSASNTKAAGSMSRDNTEQGMVMVYGNQLAVQPAEDDNQKEVEDVDSPWMEGSHIKSLKVDMDHEGMVDSVQWLRLLASSLWPKKRGGGMLHKAFDPHCAGNRYRELTLELREQLFANGNEDVIMCNGL